MLFSSTVVALWNCISVAAEFSSACGISWRKSQPIGRAQSFAGRTPGLHPGWNLPGLPGPVAAVFEKELRYLSRSGPMMFTLIVPLFMLFVFRSSGHNQGLFAHAPELTFPLGAAYSLLLADQSFLQQFRR